MLLLCMKERILEASDAHVSMRKTVHIVMASALHKLEREDDNKLTKELMGYSEEYRVARYSSRRGRGKRILFLKAAGDCPRPNLFGSFPYMLVTSPYVAVTATSRTFTGLWTGKPTNLWVNLFWWSILLIIMLYVNRASRAPSITRTTEYLKHCCYKMSFPNMSRKRFFPALTFLSFKYQR